MNLSWFLVPLIIFIVLRVIIIYVVYEIADGVEFTSDSWVYDLGLKPFSVMTFSSDASNYSQPPLYPIILAPLAIPLSHFLCHFLASRIAFTVFELISFLIMALYLSKLYSISQKNRLLILGIVSISPLGFMTGAVMKQEEAIVMIFTTLVLYTINRKSIRWAGFLTFLGMITAKILFGVVFFAILLLGKNRKAVICWGILPAIIFLTIYSLIGYIFTGVIPFIDFAPSDPKFCSSIFTLFFYFGSFSGPFMKWFSLGFVFLAYFTVWKLKYKFMQRDFPQIMLLPFCILFLFFYHINTEYHIFILPLLALIPFGRNFFQSKYIFSGFHLLLAICTWGYGIVYGIRIFSEGVGYSSYSKELSLSLYEKTLGFIPIKSMEIAFLILTILSILLILILTYKSLTSKFSPDSQ